MGTENKSIREEKINVEETFEQKIAEDSNMLVDFLFKC